MKKTLVNSGVNEKSELTKHVQPNIPWYDEYRKYDGLFTTSSD